MWLVRAVHPRALVTYSTTKTYHSPPGGVAPPDAPPFNFTATPGDGLVLLSWLPRDGLSYDAYWSETQGVTTSTGMRLENITSPHTHRGLTNTQTYHYILIAKNAGGMSKPTSERSATPIAGAAPPVPPPIPCSTRDGQINVCVEISHQKITEFQSDQPTTVVTLRVSEPIEGDRDSIQIFMRGSPSMEAGTGTLPGTATMNEDYTVAVTEPAVGYAFPEYDPGFEEFTFSLSKTRPQIKFEIRMNDDTAPPPEPPMTNPRNESTDETIMLEFIGVLGAARSGDAKVRNAVLDPDLRGGTITVTQGQYPSLSPIFEFAPGSLASSDASALFINDLGSLSNPTGTGGDIFYQLEFDSNDRLYFSGTSGVARGIYRFNKITDQFSSISMLTDSEGLSNKFAYIYYPIDVSEQHTHMVIDRTTTPNLLYLTLTSFRIDHQLRDNGGMPTGSSTGTGALAIAVFSIENLPRVRNVLNRVAPEAYTPNDSANSALHPKCALSLGMLRGIAGATLNGEIPGRSTTPSVFSYNLSRREIQDIGIAMRPFGSGTRYLYVLQSHEVYNRNTNNRSYRRTRRGVATLTGHIPFTAPITTTGTNPNCDDISAGSAYRIPYRDINSANLNMNATKLTAIYPNFADDVITLHREEVYKTGSRGGVFFTEAPEINEDEAPGRDRRSQGALQVDAMGRVYLMRDMGSTWQLRIYAQDSSGMYKTKSAIGDTSLLAVPSSNDARERRSYRNPQKVVFSKPNQGRLLERYQVRFDPESRIYVMDELSNKIEVYEACAVDLSNCDAEATPGRTPALLQTIDGTREYGKRNGAMLTDAERRAAVGRNDPKGGLFHPRAIVVDERGWLYVASKSSIGVNQTSGAPRNEIIGANIRPKITAFAPYRAP